MKKSKALGFIIGAMVVFAVSSIVTINTPIWLGVINTIALGVGLPWALGDIFERFFE